MKSSGGISISSTSTLVLPRKGVSLFVGISFVPSVDKTLPRFSNEAKFPGCFVSSLTGVGTGFPAIDLKPKSDGICTLLSCLHKYLLRSLCYSYFFYRKYHLRIECLAM